MNLHDWYLLLIEQLTKTSLLEYMAVGFGITEVLLARKNLIWLYPAGIISITLSMGLLYDAKLYAETLLNTYYLVMSFYGWAIWRKRNGAQMIKTGWSNKVELRTAMGISAFGFMILYLVLTHFTDSDVPVWDAFVSATAWAGMWLLAKRRIENWIFLNISNFFAIPLLIHKQLPLFALLTSILFVVAIFGYLDWKKTIQTHHSIPDHA